MITGLKQKLPLHFAAGAFIINIALHVSGHGRGNDDGNMIASVQKPGGNNGGGNGALPLLHGVAGGDIQGG